MRIKIILMNIMLLAVGSLCAMDGAGPSGEVQATAEARGRDLFIGNNTSDIEIACNGIKIAPGESKIINLENEKLHVDTSLEGFSQDYDDVSKFNCFEFFPFHLYLGNYQICDTIVPFKTWLRRVVNLSGNSYFTLDTDHEFKDGTSCVTLSSCSELRLKKIRPEDDRKRIQVFTQLNPDDYVVINEVLSSKRYTSDFPFSKLVKEYEATTRSMFIVQMSPTLIYVSERLLLSSLNSPLPHPSILPRRLEYAAVCLASKFIRNFEREFPDKAQEEYFPIVNNYLKRWVVELKPKKHAE